MIATSRITADVFFFNDTSTTEIYTLSLHDALPICASRTLLYNLDAGAWDPVLLERFGVPAAVLPEIRPSAADYGTTVGRRSEEHTSELQSRQYLVCRLLLEKKKPIPHNQISYLHSI